MKIAFVIPDITHRLFNENVYVVDIDFGTFPELGVCYAAAVAERWGADVRIWDAKPEKLALDRVIEELRAFGPDLVAMPVHAMQSFGDTVRWAAGIKRGTGKPILVGGYELQFIPRECFAHEAFDFGAYGTATGVLPAFLEELGGGANYGRVRGLIYRDGGNVVINDPAESVPLDDHPFPARHLLKNHLYFSHVSQRKNYTVMISSMGCPYNCTFCGIHQSGFNARSPESVIEEMRVCYSDHGVREFDFFDPLMLHDRGRAMAIGEAIIKSDMKIYWSCRSRIDTVDKEMLQLLAASGLVRIFYGIESGDEDVLKKMKKDHDMDQVRKVINLTVESGIRPLGFFQIGAPGDTVESVNRTVEFAKSLPLDYAQFMRTIGKPRSALEKEMRETLGYDYWREYAEGKRDEMALPAPWTCLDGATVEKLVRKAYLSFYFRPGYIVKMLRKVNSPSEMLKYMRTAARMLLYPSKI